MKVQVKKIEKNSPKTLYIDTEFIRLEALLKLADAVPSGGAAKMLIQEGEAAVNGEVCAMRGKKLRPGDRVTFQGREFLVAAREA